MEVYGRIKMIWLFCLLLLLLLLTVSGCATNSGTTQQELQGESGVGAALGDLVGGVVTAGIEAATGEIVGNNEGKIDRVRMLQEGTNGYLLEVDYSGVKRYQGVSVVSEVYGPQGPLTEYSSYPVPLGNTYGQVQAQISFQGTSFSQSKPYTTYIIVKLIRDGDLGKQIAVFNYKVNKHQPGVGGQPSPPAQYGKETFCNQYAQKAINQLKQGQSLGCGNLVGGAWTPNRTDHYNWCMQQPEATANSHAAYRDNHLNACRTQTGSPLSQDSFCRQYAQKALQDLRRAKEAGCGNIRPPVWDPNYKNHYNWCVRVPKGTANQGTQMRTSHLQQCMR